MKLLDLLNRSSAISSFALDIKRAFSSIGENGWLGLNNITTERVISLGLSEGKKLARPLTIAKNESTLLWVQNLETKVSMAKSKIDTARATKYIRTFTPSAASLPASGELVLNTIPTTGYSAQSIVSRSFMYSKYLRQITLPPPAKIYSISRDSRQFLKRGNSGLVERFLHKRSNPLK